MSTEAPQTTRQVVETVLLDPQERRKLMAFAWSRYSIPSEDAEDLLQETALDLLRQRQYVHSPQGYLFTVFRARCIRLLRIRMSKRTIEVTEAIADPASEAYAQEKSDQQLAIRQALCRISSTCRKLLAARYIHGESLKKAADGTTLVPSGVGTTINRCLKRLRACLN
jgi:RNA polymerase sigma factor (sigma-70 family)